MNRDFFNQLQPSTYASRGASSEWKEAIDSLVTIPNQFVLDVGCGGGIYTQALVDLGAAHVTGIDSSETMLEGANEFIGDQERISFAEGNATKLPVEDESADVVLERALIHHLKRAEFKENLQEVSRALKPGGTIIIQDRTIEDCFLPPSKEHVRGHLFTLFPHLKAVEKQRRYTSNTVVTELHQSGFHKIKINTFEETRKVFANKAELTEDLKNRTGRTILHQLDDTELDELIEAVTKPYMPNEPIHEKDRWTLWIAKKA